MYILEQHARNCEGQGRYVEAEIARNRLDELRLHEENRKREAMRARHLAEALGVEEAHMLEFQQFNAVWDKKGAAYQENAAELVLEMQERHAAELKDFQQRLLAKAAMPRHSKELLALRKVQDTLARNRRYEEAARMKHKADELMTWEEEKWHNERQADMYQQEIRYKAKLKTELLALKKRIQLGVADMKRCRQRELECLLLRYQNVKRALDRQQSIETVQFDKMAAAHDRARAAAKAKRSSA